MGKLAQLTSVKTAKIDSFVYTPPLAAFDAMRILVKPNLAYPDGPPVTVSMHVLGKVLRGLRRASPGARILIVEGGASKTSVHEIYEKCGVLDLLDDNMRVADTEELTMREYLNTNKNPVKYKRMIAPEYLAAYDCCISVATFKRTTLKDEPLISASLKNLYGLFPIEPYRGRSPYKRGKLHQPSVAEVLKDVYFTIGRFFHGAVVDLTEKLVSPDWRPDKGEAVPVGQVVWGDDLLAVDEVACRVAGEPIARYIDDIRGVKT